MDHFLVSSSERFWRGWGRLREERSGWEKKFREGVQPVPQRIASAEMLSPVWRWIVWDVKAVTSAE